MDKYSQLGQDIWILENTNYMTNGFFIDIGAYDGITISNTYLLEKQFNWNGICVEPSSAFNQLKINRQSILENICIYSKSNTFVEFHETLNNLELSGIKNSFKPDDHEQYRSNNYNVYKIITISLTDLCIKHNCPDIMDYLSIDTEGSELKILIGHNFNKYRFRYITVEHNKNINYRKKINRFLIDNGYILDNSRQNLEEKDIFDDWYKLL